MTDSPSIRDRRLRIISGRSLRQIRVGGICADIVERQDGHRACARADCRCFAQRILKCAVERRRSELYLSYAYL